MTNSFGGVYLPHLYALLPLREGMEMRFDHHKITKDTKERL